MSGHIHALTGIRGFAALWVAFHHAFGYIAPESIFSDSILQFVAMGWLGVDLFFVLSGFIISYVHQNDFLELRADAIIRFLKLRIARIYPAHLVATLIFVPIVIGSYWFGLYEYSEDMEQRYGLRRFIFSLFMLNGWGIPDSEGWNIPSWSVSSEWFAYLCFPVIAVFFLRVRSLTLSVATIVAVQSLMVILAIYIRDGEQYMLGNQWTLARVTSEFVMGAALFNIYRNLRPGAMMNYAAVISLIAIVVFNSVDVSYLYNFVSIQLFSVLIISLALSQGGVARFFASRPLVYLGKISYSIYLVHAFILIVFNQFAQRFLTLDAPEYAIVFLVVYVPSIVIGGHLLFNIIEDPARRVLRDRWINVPGKTVARPSTNSVVPKNAVG